MPPQNYESFKKRLADLLFTQDPDGRNYKKELEKMVLPKIRQKIKQKIREYKKDGIDYVVEMPTFFETRGLKKHDEYFVFLVTADRAERVKRIIKRNGISFNDAVARIKTGIPDLKKIPYSDKILYNGDIDSFMAQASDVVNGFIKEKAYSVIKQSISIIMKQFVLVS